MIDGELESLRRRHRLAPDDESIASALIEGLVRRHELEVASQVLRATCISREAGGRPPASALLALMPSLPGRAPRDWSRLATLQHLDAETQPNAAGGPNGVAWADARSLYIAHSDGSLHHTDIADGAVREVRPTATHRRAIARHDTRLVPGGPDALGFRIPPGSFAATWRSGGEVSLPGALCMAPDHRGGFLAGTLDGTVVHVAPGERRIHRIDGGDSIWGIGSCPDESLVTVTTELGGLAVYDDLRSRHRVHETGAGELMRSVVRVAPDGAAASWLSATGDGVEVHRYRWREDAWSELSLPLASPSGWSADPSHELALAWRGDDLACGAHSTPEDTVRVDLSGLGGIRRAEVDPSRRFAIVLTTTGTLVLVG